MLQNALKFTFKGEISLTVDYDYDTRHLVAHVRDTGIGISRDN